MERTAGIYLVYLSLISFLIFCSCRKTKDDLFDLYPLKVGNQFYYKYSYTYNNGHIIGHETRGNEVWSVISESSINDSIEYNIERRLVGIYVNWSELSGDIFSDTTIITDSIRYIKISEDRSSSVLSFWGITLKRYQTSPREEVRVDPTNLEIGNYYSFGADSGLTERYYSEGLMTYQIRESLILDSVKIIN
jgi:hypothetical protein